MSDDKTSIYSEVYSQTQTPLAPWGSYERLMVAPWPITSREHAICGRQQQREEEANAAYWRQEEAPAIAERLSNEKRYNATAGGSKIVHERQWEREWGRGGR